MCICTLINLFLCRSSPHPKKLHISHTFKHHCFEQLHCLKLHWLKTCFMYNLWPLWWCLHHHWHCHSHPWLCHHYHICSGACVVVVVITAAVREALPAANTAPFPTEGAAGLALNLQAWLRELQLQSPRHCSLGQRLRWSSDPRCPR